MGRTKEEILPNLSTELWIGLVTLITTLFKTFKFVQEGELGIKLTFGKARRDKGGNPKVIHPGFALLIPWVQSLKRRHVRQQTHHLDHQAIALADGLIYEVSAIVIFRVVNIYRALFEIDDLDRSIADLSMGILRKVLSAKKHGDLQNMQGISEELLSDLKEKAEEWGVEFIQFNLTDCAPSKESAPLIAAEAGVRLRLEALKKALGGNGELEEISEFLAAVLIGTPLVASISPQIHVDHKGDVKVHDGRGFLRRILEGPEEAQSTQNE